MQGFIREVYSHASYIYRNVYVTAELHNFKENEWYAPNFSSRGKRQVHKPPAYYINSEKLKSISLSYIKSFVTDEIHRLSYKLLHMGVFPHAYTDK